MQFSSFVYISVSYTHLDIAALSDPNYLPDSGSWYYIVFFLIGICLLYTSSKTAASWFGACIFLIVAATILRSFFL